MTPARRDSGAGVTLVEVLVALVLFALIAGAGFSVLDQVIRVQTRTDGRLQRLAQLQRAMLIVTQDFMQASGGSLSHADGAVTFRRSAGTGEMAVRYGIEDTALVRSVSGAGGDAPVHQILLSEVEAVAWRFLDAEREWSEAWPPSAIETTQVNPAAVALDVRLTGPAPSGALRRIAILPTDPDR